MFSQFLNFSCLSITSLFSKAQCARAPPPKKTQVSKVSKWQGPATRNMHRLGKYCLINTFAHFFKLCQNWPTNRPTWKLYNMFVENMHHKHCWSLKYAFQMVDVANGFHWLVIICLFHNLMLVTKGILRTKNFAPACQL